MVLGMHAGAACPQAPCHYHRTELVVVSIAVNDQLPTLRKFVEDNRLPYVVLWVGTLDGATARTYCVAVAPANMVVDPNGIVRFSGIGPMSLKAAVETVIAGSPDNGRNQLPH